MVLMLAIGWIGGTGLGRAAGTPRGDDGGEADQVLLRLGGEEILATTIALPLARSFLERKGAHGIAIVPAPPPWTAEIAGRMGNGDRVVILVRSALTEEAFRMLASGEIDIAMAGREPSLLEIRAMPMLGHQDDSYAAAAIARAAAVIAVNPDNPVEMLNFRQLHDIYAGTVTDWAQLGGRPGPIHALTREEGSATRQLFDSVVLGSTPLALRVRQLDSFEEMRATVASDPGAIGYLVVPESLKKVRIIVGGDTNVSPPDSYQLASGDYPLSQTLYLYRDPESGNTDVSAFFDQALAVSSQFTIASAGLSELGPALILPSGERRDSGRYEELTRNALRVSTTIRFDEGSMAVDGTAIHDLDLLARYLRLLQVRGDHLVHIAFSEWSGDPAADERVSRQLGEIVARELRRRLVAPGDVVALGALRPLVEDETPVGRGINRRVETWIRP
ncbi:MAG: substrate-binding domain-containing protein [Inquilinus limosus]|uniref:Substrate-binding domain-containing protein n=1 Tax=Inquilinus limosus TaxID=171674 RepID=A0A952KJ21_9PROT|nr:substrate-binding domain-containing protein [Inquilinus limosus]